MGNIMGLKIKATNFDTSNGDFCVEGKFDQKYRKIYLNIQIEVPHYNLNPHFAYKVTDVNEDFNFKIIFNVNELLKHKISYVPLKFVCFFICDGEKIPIKSKTNYKQYIFPSNSIFRLIPSQKETLTLILDSIPKKAKLNFINFSKDKFSIKIETDYLNGLLNEMPILSFKCREQKNLFKYYHSIEIPLNKSYNNKYLTNFDLQETTDIFLPYLKNNEFFDIFFEIKNELGIISIPLTIDKTSIDFSFKSLGNFHKIKPLINSNNQLSLFNEMNVIFKLSNFNLLNGKISFDGQITRGLNKYNKSQINSFNLNIDYCEAVVKSRSNILEESEYYDEISFSLELKNNYLEGVLNLNLFKSFFKTDEIYDLFIRLFINDFFIDIPFKANEDIKTNNTEINSFNDLLVTLILDKSMNCSLSTITNNVKHQIVKIGVLGSCFSRTAFNSMDYFNPDYKKFYNCNFSQLYHSSIISLTSKQLNNDILSSITENLNKQVVNTTDKNYILTDLNKSFFQDLKKADVDYLIIDLYADAVKNLIMFPDGSFLGTFLINLSELCPELDYDIISPRDADNTYFEIYKQNLDKFYEKILKIIPEQKIILNKGSFAYKWLNEKREIELYDENQIKFFRDINYFWDKLNNYLENKMPNINIIDLTYSNYISDYDFPFGNSAMHYESAYYKEFLNLLNKIVLEDKLRESTIKKINTQNENFKNTTKQHENNFFRNLRNILSKTKDRTLDKFRL
jgi:hypothetical protein